VDRKGSTNCRARAPATTALNRRSGRVTASWARLQFSPWGPAVPRGAQIFLQLRHLICCHRKPFGPRRHIPHGWIAGYFRRLFCSRIYRCEIAKMPSEKIDKSVVTAANCANLLSFDMNDPIALRAFTSTERARPARLAEVGRPSAGGTDRVVASAMIQKLFSYLVASTSLLGKSSAKS
jgi:hypothetical protein